MPNYEYKCTQDSSRFEIWQEVGAQPPPCPTCGAATKKVFQPPRVIFKGSGFYVTDLRSEQSAAKSKSDPAETPSSEARASEAGSSEAATEVKAGAKPAEPKPEAVPAAMAGGTKTD
ncbi:MAG: hypothetical protein KY445_10000 [Armatimonadetes bacterium]|nr:hypothetical protein [Armatimonadota bacterium]